MNENDIYQYLDRLNIWHEITEHKAVFNMDDISSVKLPYPEADAKNIFVRDDKKRNYYLITVKGNKKVNLKEFRQANNTRALSFASESDLMSIMGLMPGAVTPMGILNDDERKVQFYLDDEFTKNTELIGVHPNVNTATVWMKAEDLLGIIEEHGNTTHVVNI